MKESGEESFQVPEKKKSLKVQAVLEPIKKPSKMISINFKKEDS